MAITKVPDEQGARLAAAQAHEADDLASRLEGRWNTVLADPDGRGIRVGFLAQSALTSLEQITEFPEPLGPVQVDDEAPPSPRWDGRR